MLLSFVDQCIDEQFYSPTGVLLGETAGKCRGDRFEFDTKSPNHTVLLQIVLLGGQ